MEILHQMRKKVILHRTIRACQSGRSFEVYKKQELTGSENILDLAMVPGANNSFEGCG
jgi:hypothetical protein